MFTVNSPVSVSPPEEVNNTLKVASPCEAAARLFTGSTVKEQALAPVPRVTVILVVSTPVASPQVMVLLPSATVLEASITKVRLRPTVKVPGSVKTMLEGVLTFTVIVASREWPPEEVYRKLIVAVPVVLPAEMFMEQPFWEVMLIRGDDSVAVPQVMVKLPSAA